MAKSLGETPEDNGEELKQERQAVFQTFILFLWRAVPSLSLPVSYIGHPSATWELEYVQHDHP